MTIQYTGTPTELVSQIRKDFSSTDLKIDFVQKKINQCQKTL